MRIEVIYVIQFLRKNIKQTRHFASKKWLIFFYLYSFRWQLNLDHPVSILILLELKVSKQNTYSTEFYDTLNHRKHDLSTFCHQMPNLVTSIFLFLFCSISKLVLSQQTQTYAWEIDDVPTWAVHRLTNREICEIIGYKINIFELHNELCNWKENYC